MTRYIAILTLTLTAALNADQAFAQGVDSILFRQVLNTAQGDCGGSPCSHVRDPSVNSFNSQDIRGDLRNEALAAEAIYGAMLEYEYEMLRDAGFTHTEAKGVILLVIVADFSAAGTAHSDGFADSTPSQFRIGKRDGFGYSTPSQFSAEDIPAVYDCNPNVYIYNLGSTGQRMGYYDLDDDDSSDDSYEWTEEPPKNNAIAVPAFIGY